MRRALTVLVLLLVWAACKKADPVVGKWYAMSGKSWIEYFVDGDVILYDGAQTTSGKWQRLEDGRVKVDSVDRRGEAVEVFVVAIEGDRAVFKGSAGKAKTYQRSNGTVAEKAEVASSLTSAEPAEVDPAVARDRDAQRQTVDDAWKIGTAMFSWLTDQVGAAAAGSSQTERPGTHADMGKYIPISHAELEKILVPQYARSIPEKDGWGHPYEYYLNVKNTLAQQVLGVRSPGRDGLFSDTDYSIRAFEPDDFDEDIVWTDGFFVRWPEKKREDR
jgi:hypothetical protein